MSEVDPFDVGDLLSPSGPPGGLGKGTPATVARLRRDLPIHLSMEDIDQVASAAWLAFIKYEQISVDQVEEYLNGYEIPGEYSLGDILELKATKRAMEARGIPPATRMGLLSTKQVMALQIMFDPSTASFSTRLKRAGVTKGQWETWQSQPIFQRIYNEMSERKLTRAIPRALSALSDKASDGDINAIKLVFEMTGRHNPNGEQKFDLQAIMYQIIDVLQEELGGDGVKLMRIAKRLKVITEIAEGKNTISGELL